MNQLLTMRWFCSKSIVTVHLTFMFRYSQLRYQAIIVWISKSMDKNMPKEFEERFNSRQKRIEMGKTLVKQHENVKTVVRFDRYLSMPSKMETVLVPVILNLLPLGATAVIKVQLNSMT